jgi:tetratricopeptide (TPR) repeat protein
MSSVQPGQQLLHYEVVEQIGSGGMGEVFKAVDAKLSRPVAIKILPAEGNRDRTARRRFVQEARAASALNHRGIVTIHAIETTDEIEFIVMELLSGASVSERIVSGPVAFPEVLELGIQMAEALAAAHAAGIVHRDIKPANIMVSPTGQCTLLDFGLAKPVPTMDLHQSTKTAFTEAGVRVGTIPYMSPEQTRGEPLDGRSDMFSLGCVLYEAASGTRAFDGTSALAIMHDIATVNPSPPSSARPELPAEFDLVVQRALAKDREHRFAATDLADALRLLQRAVTDSPVSAVTAAEAHGDAEPWHIVGREEELRRLDEALTQATAKRGRTLLITGEPGIGKTTLADEFILHARRRRGAVLVARGRCVEQYGTGDTYLPFLDALDSLLSGTGGARTATVLRSHAPTWCLQLPTAFGSSGTRAELQQETIGATKDRMLRELGDALAALTAGLSVVLVLEDLHWADTPSIDLLRHLCQRAGDQRLLIVGTFRPEEVEHRDHPLRGYRHQLVGRERCEELPLPLLGPEHIERYLNARFAPNDFATTLTSLIQRKTDGHPLFATLLIQWLLERGDIAQSSATWTLQRAVSDEQVEAPQGVRSIIRTKLEALDDDDQRALQYASVEGEEFQSTVLAHLLDADDMELEERLARLDRVHRLVTTVAEEELPDGTLTTRYRFSHALYRDALYEDVVSQRRMRLHLLIGQRLVDLYRDEGGRIAASLAAHFERGRDFARAVEYLIQAGGNATHACANAEAEAQYGRALALVDRLGPEARGRTEVTLREKRGTIRLALSRFPDAIDDFTRMAELARSIDDTASEFAGLRSLTQALFFSHRLDETAERAGQALAVAERSDSAAWQADVMTLVGLKHLCYGELEDGKTSLDHAIALARSVDHRSALGHALTWRAALHYWQSDYAAADGLLVEAVRLNAEFRDGFQLLASMFFQGLVRGNQGRISESLRVLNEALAMAKRNGDAFWWPRLPNCIGWIYRELEDFDRAADYDQQGVDVGREHAVLEAQANSLINLGIDYTNVGRHGHALPVFHEVEDIFIRDAWFRWRYNIRLQAGIAEHWLKQGDADKAESFAHRLRDTATEYEAWKYVALADSLLARIAFARGDLATGLTFMETALAQLQRHPCPIVAWKLESARARACADLGKHDQAAAAFERAASIMRTIAGQIEDEPTRATFLSSPVVKRVLPPHNPVA